MAKDSFYMGRGDFYWFHGCVEDRADLDKLGKVRVRILGAHTQDKSFIPTDQLMWSYIMMPVTSASMNGIGQAPVGVVPGTHVIGFFRDGEACQDPIIIGTIGGIPQAAANNTFGFNDPRDNPNLTETFQSAPRHIKTRIYPTDGSGAQLTNDIKGPSYPIFSGTPEHDTNRIARNQNIQDTILQILKTIQDQNIPIAFSGTWSEPSLWYNGTYPYVHIEETESGHVKIQDDTPNFEGQLDVDRTGTFTEILTDGSKVEKIVKQNYTIVMADDHVFIMGNEFNRTQKDLNLSIGGRWNIEASGNINIKSDTGGLYLTVSGDANINATNININAIQKLSLTAPEIDMKASGNVNIDGTQVWINTNKANPNQIVLPKQ